ncbi:MAG TPA: PAS domain-containing protein, partial [Fibrobacteria bacterium]|nr:PAS domain-containing protein [Fibrobacteria bacterium]
MAESPNPYRDLLVSLETGFCVFELLFDAKGKVLDARVLESNAFFNRMLGREDMQGKTFLELFPGIDDSWFRIYEEAFKKKEGMRFEKHHVPSDHWYELYASPFGSPEAGRLAVVFTNITERKRAEAALRESEARERFMIRLEDAIRPLGNAAAIQEEACRLLGEHLGADRVYFGDTEGGEGRSVILPDYHRSDLPGIGGPYDPADFAEAMSLLQDGRPVQIDNLEEFPGLSERTRNALRSMGAGALFVAPLHKDGSLMGKLGVLFTQKHAWTQAEILLIPEVLERIWLAAKRAMAEEDLRKSEKKYHTLFESIDEAFCIVELIFDADGNACDFTYLEANPAFRRHGGFDPVGLRVRDLLPDYEQIWLDHYAHALRTGETVHLEHSVHGLADQWFRMSAFRYGEPDARQVAIVFTNITAERKAMDAVRASERKYRSLFESIDEGFCLLQMYFDEDGIPVDFEYLETNPAFVRQAGMAMQGRRIKDIFPDFEQYWLDAYGRVVITGEPVRLENKVAGLDKWFQTTAFRHGAPENRQVAVVFTDVTERKREEQGLRDFNIQLEQQVIARAGELKESRDLLQAIFDASVVTLDYLVAVRDEKGEILDFEWRVANAAARRHSGDWTDKPPRYAEMFPGIREKGAFERFRGVVETGKKADFEIHYDKDGYDNWFHIVAVRLGDGMVMTSQDITERRRNEEIARQAERDRTATEERQRLALLAATLNAQEEERRRIAESLHNGIGQLLYGVQLNLGQLDPEPGKAWTAQEARRRRVTSGLLTQAIEDVRRISHELMPGVLEDFGLRVALEDVCRTLSGPLSAECIFGGLPDEIAPFMQVSIYRIAQELITNVI